MSSIRLFVGPPAEWFPRRPILRWAAELFGGDLLSAESRAQMLTPVGLDENNGAYGVFVEYGDNGVALYGHTGGIGGFLTYMYYWETDKIALVAVSNRPDLKLRDLSYYGWRELLPE